MATIRRLRGRWQGMVRRRGVPPRCKSFDKRTDATRWARELEAEADRSGWVADTRLAEKTTLGELLTRYRDQVSPTKRSAHTEKARINAMVRRPIAHRTLAKLTSADVATYRDERLKHVAPATVVRELNTLSHEFFCQWRLLNILLDQGPAESTIATYARSATLAARSHTRVHTNAGSELASLNDVRSLPRKRTFMAAVEMSALCQ